MYISKHPIYTPYIHPHQKALDMFAMEKAQAEQAREEAANMQQRQTLANKCCESLAMFRTRYNLALDDGKSILLGPFMTTTPHAPPLGFTLGHARVGGAPTHLVSGVNLNPYPTQTQAAALGMQLSDQVRYYLMGY